MRCDIASVCEDHIRLAVDQANRQLWETLSLSFCISVIKGDVCPFNVTEAPQALQERADRIDLRRVKEQDAYAPNLPMRLLPKRDERCSEHYRHRQSEAKHAASIHSPPQCS